MRKWNDKKLICQMNLRLSVGRSFVTLIVNQPHHHYHHHRGSLVLVILPRFLRLGSFFLDGLS